MRPCLLHFFTSLTSSAIRYHAPLQNNVYERRAAGAVAQIYKGIAMKPDYDQLLCKKPKKTDAIFAWHQDMAYWPPTSMTPHTETATFSLAVDPTTIQNGCIKYIPGSHKGKELRRHVPVAKLTGKRDEAHAIAIQVDEAAETIVQAEVGSASPSTRAALVTLAPSGVPW